MIAGTALPIQEISERFRRSCGEDHQPWPKVSKKAGSVSGPRLLIFMALFSPGYIINPECGIPLANQPEFGDIAAIGFYADRFPPGG